VFRKRPDGSYASSLLEEIGWVRHGFGTRRFPLGLDASPVALLRQIHSARTLAVDGAEGWAGEGDAMITARPGQYLGIRTADCLPVLLAAPDVRAVAAVHAGWRGAAAGILRATIERLAEDWGADPGRIVAAIGPGIGPCCYEVGPEVAGRFPIAAVRVLESGCTHLDLREAARRELVSAGVPEERIDVADLCTRCRLEEFFSYRGNRAEGGRMRNVIGVWRPSAEERGAAGNLRRA